MSKDIRGIILAAGRGSRMGHHASNKPICRTVLHDILNEYFILALVA